MGSLSSQVGAEEAFVPMRTGYGCATYGYDFVEKSAVRMART